MTGQLSGGAAILCTRGATKPSWVLRMYLPREGGGDWVTSVAMRFSQAREHAHKWESRGFSRTERALRGRLPVVFIRQLKGNELRDHLPSPLCVEVVVERQAGGKRPLRSSPIDNWEAAWREHQQHRALGYTARIIAPHAPIGAAAVAAAGGVS